MSVLGFLSVCPWYKYVGAFLCRGAGEKGAGGVGG
jgi:hypothetical protein